MTSSTKPQTAGESTPKPIQFTTRNPPWTYIHLQLYATVSLTITLLDHHTNNSRIHQQTPFPQTNPTPLDAVTARTYLTSALSQFLGLTGSSIPIDILKIASEQPHTQEEIWIRVPRDDASAVVAALSSWVGGKSGASGSGGGSVAWRVCAKGNFLGAVGAGSGGGLFGVG